MITTPEDRVASKTSLQTLGAAAVSLESGPLRTLPRSEYGTPRWYKLVRKMRRDPTIALVRTLFAAPIMVSTWGIESSQNASPESVEFIKATLLPWKRTILRNAIRGALFDFGWQPFEVVLDPVEGGILQIKPLLQDFTEILTWSDTGEFAGLVQFGDDEEKRVELTELESFCVSFDVEGTDWYGNPIMPSAEAPYNASLSVETAGRAYIRKVSGSHWIIKYPVGTTLVNNVETDNLEVAKLLLGALENSGSVAVPVEEQAQMAEAGWSIELESDSGHGHDVLIDRALYCDKLKVRAFGFPERAILEGEFGTKADASTHSSFALTQLELRHLDIVDPVNEQLVNRLLINKFGPEAKGSVWIRPQSLSDNAMSLLRELYRMILQNPDELYNELQQLDMTAVRQRLELPERHESEAPEERPGRPQEYQGGAPPKKLSDLAQEVASI